MAHFSACKRAANNQDAAGCKTDGFAETHTLFATAWVEWSTTTKIALEVDGFERENALVLKRERPRSVLV